MRIVFTRVPEGESVVTIHRPDGVVVRLPSYSRKHRVPHDLAHAVTERELGLAGGIFGTLASGGMFSNARVVAGRPRHDAAQRSARLLRANARDLGVAELLGGVAHRAVEHGHGDDIVALVAQAWSVVGPGAPPFPDEQLVAAAQRLDELGREWEGIPVGGHLEFPWPDRLLRPIPPPERRRESARPGSRR